LLGNSQYDYITKIIEAHVFMTINSSNTTSVMVSVEAYVVTHSIPLRDLSIPVEYWTQSGGGNGWNNLVVNNTTGTAPFSVNYLKYHVLQPYNYGLQLDGKGNLVKDSLIKLNGIERFKVQEHGYFNYLQPYNVHTHTPPDGVNVFPFALFPEQFQPSGSCNMSRIDTLELNCTLQDLLRPVNVAPPLDFVTGTIMRVWAVNLNILRIVSGMGGLAFSN